MSLILIERIANLNGPIIPDTLNGVLNGSEIDAHKFIITATRDGAQVTLTGTVTASFLRADGAEVVLTGEIEDGAATVTLAQSCYAVPGRFDLTIFVTADGVKTGVYACTGGVRNTTSGTIVDPGQIVPSVDDIIAKQEELAQDVADASSAIASAQNAVSYLAPVFSTSQTYAVGEYVTKDGALYVCTTAVETAGAWDASKWQAVTFGGEITDLKSAIANPPVFSIIRKGKVYGNFWDEDTKAYGYYDTTSTNLGALITGGTSWYYSPTYIPVNVGDVIVYNNSRPIVCAYDGEGNIVACTQPSWSGYTVPSGVAFLRFSVAVASANGMCIFVNGTNQLEYKQKTQLYIPNLIIKKPTIIVAANGDYTSLTQALYATADEHPDVYVKVGTYDIVAEYKALFGNDIFDTMTYATEGMKNFQWGLYIDNRTVTFAAGAKVVCDMSAYTNDGTRRFSPFNLGMNAVIDGLDCYAVNPYYIIHDDFGDASEAFTNVIRNCVLITPEASQGNVIGGGCRMYSTKIVDNCYLDNGNNKPVAMRYHNTNVNGSTPVVIIKNTRANSKIRLNYYGTQTTKMTAIVNNCKALAIEKAAETEGSTDNVTLYEWCNETGS